MLAASGYMRLAVLAGPLVFAPALGLRPSPVTWTQAGAVRGLGLYLGGHTPGSWDQAPGVRCALSRPAPGEPSA